MEHAMRRDQPVRERTSGIYGKIVRCLWEIDRATSAPAQPIYMVRFDDGREKRCTDADIQAVNVTFFD